MPVHHLPVETRNMYDQKTTEKVADRRRHKRFRIRDGALAFLGSFPGVITDISQGGIGVKYVVLEQKKDENFKLDIFFPQGDFFLPGIPGRLVSDVEYPSEAPFSAVKVKRLGIQFGQLTGEQEQRLKYFLLHNAIAEA